MTRSAAVSSNLMRQLMLLTSFLFLSFGVAAESAITTETLRLNFDSDGNLQSAFSCFPSCSGEDVRVQQFGGTSLIVADHESGGVWEQSESSSETHYELHFARSSGDSLTWRIPLRGYLLELEIVGAADLTIQSGESFRPRQAAGFASWLEQSRYAWFEDGDVRQAGFDDTDVTAATPDKWLGYRNRFWTMMALPPTPAEAVLTTADGTQDAHIRFNATPAGQWAFYLGPIEPVVLKSSHAMLSDLLYSGLWFWLRWICFGLFYLIAWIKLVVPSWGLAVMAMSLIVNIVMLPLNRIADNLQQEVNDTEARLAPELQRIKKNFKGQEQAAKILALYESERVHPLYSLKSMMGVAVIIPVFIGAFNMLAENIHLLNAGFLWISDLSRPDDLFRMPFSLPFFGAEFNLLPFLMTGLSVLASSLHNPPALNAELRRKQLRNMALMAVAFFVLFYTFPAGMVLYWATSNLISVIKSLWARR
jgi:YidC/Oxa1 family membrane protein insertase